MDIQEQGVWVDKETRRLQCKHCGKKMAGLQHLKCHLAGLGPNVTPCTSTVKETFQNVVTREKPNLTDAKGKSVGEVQLANAHNRGRSQDSPRESVSPTAVEANKLVLLPSKSRKCIGECSSYANFSAAEESSGFFREMMMNAADGTIPDLKGPMLAEALGEMKDYGKKIKDSWKITGCSILLEAWIDSKGRDLVTFVADSPAGAVYLTSLDVSDIKHDINGLISLVDGLVDEVGVHNVVQIVACSTSGWVGELGKYYAGNNKGVFWSVSVSHCFELMLLKIGDIKIGGIDHALGHIVDAVNVITDYINNNPLLIRGQDHSLPIDVTVSSEFAFFSPYLTLESIFRAKKDLAAMLASSDRRNGQDLVVSKLVNDSTFWETVDKVLKCTSPLIHGLLWFSEANNQHVGNIYETMDVIKESIAREFNNKKSCYEPLWDVIDDVWNKHLHSPLHAAGYFLNPVTFYSEDFHLDSEVATGLCSSLVHLVKESDIQFKIATQLDIYRVGEDCFNEAGQADQITGITPADWWAQKASQHPELQSFAIKVLSQTCQGASRFKLQTRLAEKLLITKGMTSSEQERLKDLAIVLYNLHLKNCKAKLSEEH